MDRENEKLFTCACGSIEHHFVMSYWSDEEEPRMIYVQMFLAEHRLLKRIWLAIRYILGYKSKYGHWEEVLLDREKVAGLIKYLRQYEESL